MKTYLLIVLLALLCVACGGGGSDVESAPADKPTPGINCNTSLELCK